MNPKAETEMKHNRIIWLMALFLTSVIAWGQTTSLTDNGDGTWTLASMPAYNVALEVEYEDITPGEPISLINNGDGTWTLASMPACNVALQVEYEDATPEDAIDLIDNGDGTWTLASMPGYNVALEVEYEDEAPVAPIDLIDNGDGTWTLASMPAYNVALEVEYEDDDSNSEVYTEFAENTGTLTYYYDGQREEREQTGAKTELYDPVGDPDAARFTGYYKKVTKAVIDPSMKKAHMTSFNGMFYGGTNPETWVMQSLSKMTSIEGLENLNTEDVTDMSNMFSSCSSLTSLDLSMFNTSNVTKMVAMFQLCQNLEIVDVSSFDISKVTDMGQMFNYCPKLTTICCLSDWSGTTATSDFMFSNCTSLVGGKGTVFDNNFRDKTYARPDGGPGSPGYFTAETMTGISLTPDPSPGRGEIYNLAGQMVNGQLPRGINIIRYSDGTTRKIMVR